MSDREQHATIRGHTLINPTLEAFAPRLREAERLLASVDFGEDHERRVHAASDGERDLWAASLSEGIGNAVALCEAVAEARRFFSPETISTLRSWGQVAGTDCRVFARWEDGGLLIGQTEESCTTIRREAAIDSVMQEVPSLGDIDL